MYYAFLEVEKATHADAGKERLVGELYGSLAWLDAKNGVGAEISKRAEFGL